VTDSMFHTAARTLAATVPDAALAEGLLYPPLPGIRAVSAVIGEAVAEVAYAEGIATAPRPADLGAAVRALMWEPRYPDLLGEAP
jgi:malate dehydrogenase (oxaloacetate-decarboxylating)(NADP+)